MNKFFLFLCMAILILGVASSATADSSGLQAAGKNPKVNAPTPVPEPMSIALLGGGLVGLYGLKKKFGKD